MTDDCFEGREIFQQGGMDDMQGLEDLYFKLGPVIVSLAVWQADWISSLLYSIGPSKTSQPILSTT